MLIGQKWNLSNTHPTDWPPSAAYMGYPEICDYRANHDHHGLGEGVFPPGEAPPDHPNGLCYLTDVWKPVEEILDLLGDPDPDWIGGELFTDTEDSFIDIRSEGEDITDFMQYQRAFRGHLPRMEMWERIEIIREDFKKVGKDLDEEGALKYFNAVRNYTNNGYRDIRRAQLAELNEGKPIEDADLKEKIDLIEEYIASVPLYPENVPLYRGFGSRNIENLQAFENAYVNGELITMSGISSWTSEKVIAFDFLTGKDHVAVFELVSNKTGVSIKHLSAFPEEAEVLFGTNATYRIIGKYEERDVERGMVTVYKVEEVI
jgi:predicted RNA-binding protein